MDTVNPENKFWLEKKGERDLDCLWRIGSGWVSSVCPSSQEGKPHLGMHHAQHHQPDKRQSSCWIEAWCGSTPSPGSSAGHQSLKRMWRSLNTSRGGEQSWWKSWKVCRLRSGWELKSLTGLEEKRLRSELMLCTASWQGKWWERCWYFLPGIQGLGRMFSSRGWSNPETGPSERLLILHTCQCHKRKVLVDGLQNILGIDQPLKCSGS